MSFKVIFIVLVALGCVNSACTPTVQSLTQEQKTAILKQHNDLRTAVANGEKSVPGASDMSQLQWSDSLQTSAQNWANGCVFAHSTSNGKYGENLWSAGGSLGTFDATAPVQAWFDEIKDFDATTIASYKFDTKTGHFTQVVWAATTDLGCGFIQYEESGSTKRMVVCQYSPPGNFIGSKIYTAQSGTAGAGTTSAATTSATTTSGTTNSTVASTVPNNSVILGALLIIGILFSL